MTAVPGITATVTATVRDQDGNIRSSAEENQEGTP